jgi:hypothetical protein
MTYTEIAAAVDIREIRVEITQGRYAQRYDINIPNREDFREFFSKDGMFQIARTHGATGSLTFFPPSTVTEDRFDPSMA